jgi:hypothetical protein
MGLACSKEMRGGLVAIPRDARRSARTSVFGFMRPVHLFHSSSPRSVMSLAFGCCVFVLSGLEDQLRRPTGVKPGEIAAVELGELALEPHVEGLGRSREACNNPCRLLALQVRDGRLPAPGAHEPDLLPGDAQTAPQILVLLPARTRQLLQEPPPPLLPAREDGTDDADTRTRQNCHTPLCQIANRRPAVRASSRIISI